MSTVSSPTISTFSGLRTDWFEWFNNFRNFARTKCPTASAYGLLPFLYPNNHAYLLTLPGLDLPLRYPIHPGAPPELADNATVAQVGFFNAQLSIYRLNLDTHTLFQTEYNNLLQLYHTHLPPQTIQSIRDPIHGMTQMTLSTTTTACSALYGILSNADLVANEASLRIPYNSAEDIHTYTNKQTLAHDVAAANNQPFPETQKVNFLLNGITPCGIFGQHILMWRAAHGPVDQQLYDQLVRDVHEWSNSLGSTTTSALGYSSAAVLPAIDYTALAAAVAAHNQQQPARQPQRIPFTNRRAAPLQRPPARPLSQAIQPIYPPNYCWTHGSGHSGTHCRFPARGHRNDATFANKMGGHP